MGDLQEFMNKKGFSIFVDEYYHNNNMRGHSHDFYEFVLVKNGFTAQNLNGTFSILTPGDVFGMHPGEFHRYFNARNANVINCLFYEEAIDRYFHKLSQYPGFGDIFRKSLGHKPFKVHLDIVQRQELSTLLYKMQKECMKPGLGSDLRLEALLLDFLILISRAYEVNGSISINSEYIQTKGIIDSIEYIEKNFSNHIKLEEIASLSKLSTDYFSKMFKTMTGVTPSVYLQFIRISNAAELLTNTNLSVSDISYKVGIEDANYFTRLFKKVTGVTPIAYRDQADISYKAQDKTKDG
jgi:AraC-like DNA-binding protein